MKQMSQNTKKRPSMRLLVVLTVGTTLLVFLMTLTYIFLTNMFEILEESEIDHIRTKSDIVTNSINTSTGEARTFATDWAGLNETYDFALGKKNGNFEKHWIEDWAMQEQKYNFLIVKNSVGNDLLVKYYDYFDKQDIPTPEGFSAFLAALSTYMNINLQEQKPEGSDGFVFYGGTAYYICSRPITGSDKNTPPAGSLFLGRIINNREIERIVNTPDLQFAILEISSPEIQKLDFNFTSGGSFINTAEESIALYTSLPGFMGATSAILKVQKPRDLYMLGLNVIKLSSLVLGIAVLFFVGIISYLIERYLLRPLERISSDVQSVATSSESIDTSRYGFSKEFYTLTTSINSMLERLTFNQKIAMQSTISINILQSLLDALDTYLFVADIETRTLLFVNDKMKEHFKLGDNIIGKPCREVISPCKLKTCELCPKTKLLENPDQVIIQEEKIDVTGRYYRKVDQIIEWFGGKKVHLQYFIDITELKQAEKALEKRLEQERLMSIVSQNFLAFDDMQTAITSVLGHAGQFMNVCKIMLTRYDEKDASLKLQYAWNSKNKAAVTSGNNLPFNEYTPLYEELIKNNYMPIAVNDTDTKEPHFKHTELMAIKSLLAIPLFASKNFWGILEFDRCEAAYAWSESDIHLGELIGNALSSALTRQDAEKELLQMQALINCAPQYISYINTDGEFYFFNPATCEITGYSYEELMAGGIHILHDEQTNHQIKNDIIPKIRTQGNHQFQLPLTCKNGEVRFMSFSAFTVGSGMEKQGCIGTDITENKLLEKKLTEAKEAAEQASHAKSEFLSRMSHEMRTPMSAIIGMTNIARNAKDPEKKEYCLGKIEDASKHLLGVINDILDMSKIEANKFELSYSEFNIEKMLMNTIGIVNFRAEEKQQNLIVNIDKNVPSDIVGDSQRLSQIITNLLSNAVKFTPNAGTIVLNMKKIAEQDDICTLQVEVIDNGIGIPPKQQQLLFNSFEQGNGGIARKYGGTGLGLAISKRIVELMGGKIWIESELGEGAKFIFTIKAKKGVCRPKPAFLSGINKDNLRILAVDDSPEIRDYFNHIMRSFGLVCDVAASGAEALERLERLADCEENSYNMFFVDWMMPEMNGIELTKKIKQVAKDNVIVIMISVAEWNDIETEAVAAGVSRFISKPLFPSVLLNSINEYLGLDSKDNMHPETILIANSFKNHTILLAEDVEVNREIISDFLKNTGAIIDFAEDGLEALNLFKKHPSRYSLILMDIHMPEMDGYETTRTIRSLSYDEAKSIPIIAMTANVFREDIENCLAAGMNDHIGKPIDIDELCTKLKKYLPPKKSVLETGTIASSTSYKPLNIDGKLELDLSNPASSNDYSRFLPVLDVPGALRRVMNNKMLYFTLLKNFKGRQMANELIQNIKENDFTKMAQTAHALKGAALNLGLNELSGVTKSIEEHSKSKLSCEQFIDLLNAAIDSALENINMLLESEGVK